MRRWDDKPQASVSNMELKQRFLISFEKVEIGRSSLRSGSKSRMNVGKDDGSLQEPTARFTDDDVEWDYFFRTVDTFKF